MQEIIKLLGEIVLLIKSIIAKLTQISIEGASQSLQYDWSDIDQDENPTGSKWIPWLYTAKSLMGTKEISGSKSNWRIMSWAKNIGGWVTSYYTNDDIPWCGLFVDHCLRANNIELYLSNPLSAREWLNFGFKVEPCRGAIMVFSRSGGGHVGFYVSEDSSYYHILGGNQSNTVNVTKIAKDRFLGARWPDRYPTLHSRVKGRVYKKFDGTVSVNEA